MADALRDLPALERILAGLTPDQAEAVAHGEGRGARGAGGKSKGDRGIGRTGDDCIGGI